MNKIASAGRKVETVNNVLKNLLYKCVETMYTSELKSVLVVEGLRLHYPLWMYRFFAFTLKQYIFELQCKNVARDNFCPNYHLRAAG